MKCCPPCQIHMQFIMDKAQATCAPLMVASLMLAPTGSAHAGASLLVDDAAVPPAGHCQVETWARAYSHGRELTAVPACNYAGTELGFGVSDFFKAGTGPLLNLGVKRLWRDFDQDAFGIGASGGATWNADSKNVEFWSFNIPVSVALNAHRNLVLHANLGWLDTRGIGQGLTGGVGMERVLTTATVLLAEFYVQHDQVSIAQLGLRHIVSEAVNVDVLVGHQDHVVNGSTFATLGVNILLR